MGPTPGRAGGHFGSRPPPPNAASGAQCWRAWHQLVATHLNTSGCLHALWPGPTRHLWAMGPAPGGALALAQAVHRPAPPWTAQSFPGSYGKLLGIGPLAGPNWQNACCHPNSAGAHAAAHTTCGPLAWGRQGLGVPTQWARGAWRPECTHTQTAQSHTKSTPHTENTHTQSTSHTRSTRTHRAHGNRGTLTHGRHSHTGQTRTKTHTAHPRVTTHSHT